MSATPPDQRPGGRDVPPVRGRGRATTRLVWLVWLAGTGLGVVVPYLLAPPSGTGSGHVIAALACSVGGVLVMLVAGFALWVRTKEVGVLLVTVVPAVTVMIAAFSLMGTKLFV